MTEAVQEKQRKKAKRLTPRQRQEILNLWATGEVTYEVLMNRYGMTKRTFQQLFAKEGVKRGERVHEIQKAVDDEFKKAIQQDAEIVANRTRETKEEHYKLNQVIAKLTGKILLESNAAKESIGNRINDFKALANAANALKTTREERFRCLGIGESDSSDKDAVEELMIREMTVQDILDMQEKSRIDVNADFDSGKLDVDEGLGQLDDELIRADQEGGLDEDGNV